MNNFYLKNFLIKAIDEEVRKLQSKSLNPQNTSR